MSYYLLVLAGDMHVRRHVQEYLLCFRVYILKRPKMSPWQSSWKEVKTERLLGTTQRVFVLFVLFLWSEIDVQPPNLQKAFIRVLHFLRKDFQFWNNREIDFFLQRNWCYCRKKQKNSDCHHQFLNKIIECSCYSKWLFINFYHS